MLPNSKVYEAYDKLNLPRDASMQDVHDRISKLRARFVASGDEDRLTEAESAFVIIETNEAAKRAQREMASIHNRTKSERDLDGSLVKLTIENSSVVQAKRAVAAGSSTEEVKKQKTESDVKDEDGPSPQPVAPSGDEVVFEKLNKLLVDETKYIRALNVLCNVIKSLIEKNKISGEIVNLIIGTMEIVMTCKSNSDSRTPLANLNEDNRKAVAKALSIIQSSESMVSMIKSKGYFWSIWIHVSNFRNSFYEFDNFQFSKSCKELIRLIDEVELEGLSDESERWLTELAITAVVLCSKYVSRIIPGRVNEVKTTMTEIYKLTRVKDFPKQFKDSVAELQLSLTSS